MEKVWECWTRPEHISGWAFASDDWEAVGVENDVRVGGKFKTRMQAKGGSEGFDFTGVYTAVEENKLIEYDMEDARHVRIEFEETPDPSTGSGQAAKITETFDAESENSEETQRAGWQAILDNFKKYVEGRD